MQTARTVQAMGFEWDLNPSSYFNIEILVVLAYFAATSWWWPTARHLWLWIPAWWQAELILDTGGSWALAVHMESFMLPCTALVRSQSLPGLSKPLVLQNYLWYKSVPGISSSLSCCWVLCGCLESSSASGHTMTSQFWFSIVGVTRAFPDIRIHLEQNVNLFPPLNQNKGVHRGTNMWPGVHGACRAGALCRPDSRETLYCQVHRKNPGVLSSKQLLYELDVKWRAVLWINNGRPAPSLHCPQHLRVTFNLLQVVSTKARQGKRSNYSHEQINNKPGARFWSISTVFQVLSPTTLYWCPVLLRMEIICIVRGHGKRGFSQARLLWPDCTSHFFFYI